MINPTITRTQVSGHPVSLASSGLPAGDMEKHPALKLVRRLCEALAEERVRYCHWKSNLEIARSASGENDLDLLVSRADAGLFATVLCRLGFKEASAAAELQLPSIQDYYGYDRETGKLVHVHAHYQLVVGDDMTKNYRLPMETPYLESAEGDGLFRIARPEFEFIALVIRMVLKHCAWDAIVSGQGRLPRGARRELQDLQPRVNRDEVYGILQEHLPYVDRALFDRCEEALRPNSPAWTRIRVAQQLHRSLQAFGRRPQLLDDLMKLWRRTGWVVRRRLLKRPSRHRLRTGGALIAIVGGDGAGKSTAIGELARWISKDFDTARVHMGKPHWSLVTLGVRGLVGLGRQLGLFPYTRLADRPYGGSRSSTLSLYAAMLRAVCTAHDRYRSYVAARRLANNGGLVICDRYPLPQLKLMDAPQARHLTALAARSPLLRLLAQAEEQYYRRIVAPDLLVVLRLDPEIAVQRKTTEDAAAVRSRSQEIWSLDWRQTPAQVVDASLPQHAVLSELKSLIWSRL